jgi:hypothetical protein
VVAFARLNHLDAKPCSEQISDSFLIKNNNPESAKADSE